MNAARPKSEIELVQTTIRLPPELIKAAKQRALDEEVTVQEVVTRALRAYLGKKAGH
jgi:predicted HicB family RNase H-like nuclease